MGKEHLFKQRTSKTPQQFIGDMREKAPQFGFRVHEVVDMRELYDGYGIDAADNFEVYTVTLCNPQKSYKSITKNPERNAAIIGQKNIIVYKGDKGVTIINYLTLPREFGKEVFPEDEEFPESLHQSCRKRIEIIEASL